MLDQFSRTRLQFGKECMEQLFDSRVAIFGIGGVGGYCAEALARTGIGGIDLFDDDRICVTNINRQIIATHKTIGQYKVDVMKERILDINPKARVQAYKVFYGLKTADDIDLSPYDYIIDAVDTVTAKLELVVRAKAVQVPIISSMGAANKLDPTAFEVTDIFKTSVCPLAKVMRKELRSRGVGALKVVFSTEPAMKPEKEEEISFKQDYICSPEATQKSTHKRQVPASNAFVPAACGLILAGEVIKDISNVRDKLPNRDRAKNGMAATSCGSRHLP